MSDPSIATHSTDTCSFYLRAIIFDADIIFNSDLTHVRDMRSITPHSTPIPLQRLFKLHLPARRNKYPNNSDHAPRRSNNFICICHAECSSSFFPSSSVVPRRLQRSIPGVANDVYQHTCTRWLHTCKVEPRA